MQPIQINKDWRVSRDAYNTTLEQRCSVEIRENGKKTGETKDGWNESYFSSLEGALAYALETDAMGASSLKEMVERMRGFKRDVARMVESSTVPKMMELQYHLENHKAMLAVAREKIRAQEAELKEKNS